MVTHPLDHEAAKLWAHGHVSYYDGDPDWAKKLRHLCRCYLDALARAQKAERFLREHGPVTLDILRENVRVEMYPPGEAPQEMLAELLDELVKP